jgi:hypothetical protein
MQQGRWMTDDARCQMPEMSETVWKTQVNNSRVFAETRKKNSQERGKMHEKESLHRKMFPAFCPIVFSQSDSSQTTGSLMLLVQ